MTAPLVERRRHPRIALKGTAILLSGELAVRCRLANLSEGGFLGTTLVTAPVRLLGRTADIELRLDDPEAKWIRVESRVMRINAEHVAVCFNQPRPALVRLIESMQIAARLRARTLSIVLVDETPARRHAIAEGFRDVGCNVIEAATPLEAVVRLGELAFEPDLIAVADTVHVDAALEMRDFIRRNHPRVKLVAVGDELVAPAGDPRWLSSADPGHDLPLRIRQLLARPFP